MNKLKLLYIAGFPRSGSTIISNVINEIEGFFNAGELLYIWDRIESPEGICGCGSRVVDCDIWKPVLEGAFGKELDIDIEETIKLRDKHWRTGKLMLWLLSSAAKNGMKKELEGYLKNVERLYASIQKNLPCKVLVDSSKNASYLYWLSLIDMLDIYVLHIVRDARANVHSLLRKKEGVMSIRKSALTGALSWSQRNYALDRLGKEFGQKYLFLKYEDFISDPQSGLRTILELVGESDASLDFIRDGEIEFGKNHCVYGNTDLFKKGKIKLKQDNRWVSDMSQGGKWLVSALAWPLMRNYGY